MATLRIGQRIGIGFGLMIAGLVALSAINFTGLARISGTYNGASAGAAAATAAAAALGRASSGRPSGAVTSAGATVNRTVARLPSTVRSTYLTELWWARASRTGARANASAAPSATAGQGRTARF